MQYSAIEAARIISESGTAPKSWCDFVEKLRREAGLEDAKPDSEVEG